MKQDRESLIQRAIVAYLRRVIHAIVHHLAEGRAAARLAGWTARWPSREGQVAGSDLIVIPWPISARCSRGEIPTEAPSAAQAAC